jgi:hypothetical protein
MPKPPQDLDGFTEPNLDLDIAFLETPGLVEHLDAEESAATPPNPLDSLKPTGSLEGDAKQEVGAILAAIHADRRQMEKTMQDRTDSEFWCQVIFQTRAQKEAFLTACQMIEHGDKYVDGLLLAEKLGVALPPEHIKMEAWKPKFQQIPRIPGKGVK